MFGIGTMFGAGSTPSLSGSSSASQRTGAVSVGGLNMGGATGAGQWTTIALVGAVIVVALVALRRK